ncbi:MAG TPA: hypothetical protein VNC17_17635, partial [Thermoleophilaceae bacterium]|nr:hypothetical protein [Thermoleophilaceae bacterium]
MIASIVDTDALLTVIWASLAAGIGVTAAFGFAILGGVRAIELGRTGRVGEAAIFAVIGMLGVAATFAAIVFGIVV